MSGIEFSESFPSYVRQEAIVIHLFVASHFADNNHVSKSFIRISEIVLLNLILKQIVR